MKNDDFDKELERLLDLYDKGRLPASEKTRLDQLLDDYKVSDVNAHEFTGQHDDEMWKRINSKTSEKSSGPRRWIVLAAAVFVAGLAAVITLSLNSNQSTPGKIILDDGSIVWLKGDATLDHSKLTKDNREVSLTGEGLFEVAKDRSHPFIIHCGKYVARVLGTSFNIKTSDNSIELTVLTGQVKLSSLTTDSSIVVKQHEHVIFTEYDGVVKKDESDQETMKVVTKNTEYDMYFEDTKMDDIVKRVEGKFDVKIELEDETLRNCMISADFTDQSLRTTLTMISEALGIQYEIEGNNIIIHGVGCKE